MLLFPLILPFFGQSAQYSSLPSRVRLRNAVQFLLRNCKENRSVGVASSHHHKVCEHLPDEAPVTIAVLAIAQREISYTVKGDRTTYERI